MKVYDLSRCLFFESVTVCHCCVQPPADVAPPTEATMNFRKWRKELVEQG